MHFSFLLHILVVCSVNLTFATNDLKNAPKTEKITMNDARDKRQLSNFDENHKPPIQRRITTNYAPHVDHTLNFLNQYSGSPEKDFSIAASSYPKYPSYGPSYSVQPNHQYVGGYQQPQYVDAPEPIIEIIIKDSNETLPTPEPIKYQPPKKKKEQVQVFYVKYNKDEKKGLIIDDPIPALTPSHFNQEESEEEDAEHNHALYVQPTAPPPVRSTTLRTIIKPDSEVYHSNSGIHVTFNTESKHQSGHEFQEHYEESALQPIISEVHNPSVDQSPAKGPFVQSAIPSNHQQNSNDRARAFEIPYNNHNSNNGPQGPGHLGPHNYHRFGPPTHLNSPPFLRPTADQGLLLSYTQNQANRLYQSQNFDNRFKNVLPATNQNTEQNHRFAEPHHLNLPTSSSSNSVKFRGQSATNQQPKPIPIPLHHSDKINHHPHYTNYNQFRLKPQNYPIQQIQQSPQFQQSFPQAIRVFNQQNASPEPNNHRLPPQIIQTNSLHNSNPIVSNQNGNIPLQEHAPNKVHFQQKGTAHLGPSNPNGVINQPSQPIFPGSTQEFNHLVSGAELVESLPKFEQHITETVPLSEINKPFSPFRHISSIQSTSVQLDSPQNPQPQHSHHIQQTQRVIQEKRKYSQDEKKPIYQSETSNVSKISPQIVFPVNYNSNSNSNSNSKNYQPTQHQQTFNLNAIPSNSNHAVPIFREKLIPGKGVSNLATDVFADSYHSQQSYNHDTAPHTEIKHQFSEHNKPSFSFSSTERNFVTNSNVISTRKVTSASSLAPTTTTTTTAKPKSKKVTANLPDEVPDDLRQQLLSSGILENADISILDYDKVGDIPLEALPPEHLANFYGAGGATQISSSNRVLNIVKPNGDSVPNLQYTDDDVTEVKKSKTLPKKQNVDLKVVRFDSNNQKSIANKYIKHDSTVLPSVDINQDYNRYLPLKINGEQFPIPDVESLRNKKISSVVVLAPVDGLGSSETDNEEVIEDGRYERDIIDSKEVKIVAGDSLKSLLRKPTKENFKRWLEKEAKTNIDMQSVVLLVVKNDSNGQEIYMYDIGTRSISRLKGELSSAFVNVAESNANAQDDDINNESVTLIDTNIHEKMTAMDSENEKITIVHANSYGPKATRPIFRRDSSTSTNTNKEDLKKISISSGYSVIKR